MSEKKELCDLYTRLDEVDNDVFYMAISNINAKNDANRSAKGAALNCAHMFLATAKSVLDEVMDGKLDRYADGYSDERTGELLIALLKEYTAK